MKMWVKCLIVGLFLAGCTKANPTFDLLDADAIPQPKFNGSTVKMIASNSASDTYAISGQCDPKISSITGLVVGVQSAFDSLSTLSTSGATIQCSSNGTFSFDLKSLTDLGFTVTADSTYEIQLRAVTSAGTSKPSYIRITYSTGHGGPRIQIAGGGITGSADQAHKAMGTGLSAIIRVNTYAPDSPTLNPEAMTTLSGTGPGGSFNLKLGAASRYH